MKRRRPRGFAHRQEGQVNAGRTRHASSALPHAPLLSSASRHWDGIVVELHHFDTVDVVVPVREHLVGVHVTGAVTLLQARNGKASVRHLRAGDVTVTPVGEPKRFQHTGENVVLILRLAPDFVQQVAGDEYALNPTRFELQESLGARDPELVAIGNRLLAGLGTEGTPTRMLVESLTVELSIHLLRQYGSAPLSERRPVSRLSPRKLQRVVEYIDANLREDMALDDLAGLHAMSRSHFAHLFRTTTGLPPHRFVLERRIERAKALLRETDLPITEIAAQVGCASHSHLSVLFHREAGITPRDYRQQH
jgi:AraC family transcriptional regulator